MRLVSIVALCSVAYASYVPSAESGSPRKLAARGNCPPGQGNNSRNQCVPCTAGTFGMGGFATCMSCPTGASSNGGSASCNQCNPGYRTNPMSTTAVDKCLACLPGQSSTANAATCTPCPSNTYSGSAGGTCAACPAGMISSPGATSCSRSCPAGQYPVVAVCMDCPAGSYSTPGSMACTDCPAGQVSDPGSSTCTACDPGWVPNTSGRNCRKCPANTYANGDDCTDCPVGQTSQPGSTSCGPQPSKRALPPIRREEETCSSKPGHMWCPVLSGKRGNECINVLATLDSCGGCIAPGGSDKFTGKDCSAIPNVDQVKCERGRCKIMSCREGYVAGQGACVHALGHNAKLRRAALSHSRHEQF
ncbi:GCC2 and GCC3 domain protein [Ceratobasidium sp. AG-Ba]|nr:GCC2 and GCC3 domain protein [Ceratobasidium sp. AG-Ba]